MNSENDTLNKGASHVFSGICQNFTITELAERFCDCSNRFDMSGIRHCGELETLDTFTRKFNFLRLASYFLVKTFVSAATCLMLVAYLRLWRMKLLSMWCNICSRSASRWWTVGCLRQRRCWLNASTSSSTQATPVWPALSWLLQLNTSLLLSWSWVAKGEQIWEEGWGLGGRAN